MPARAIWIALMFSLLLPPAHAQQPDQNKKPSDSQQETQSLEDMEIAALSDNLDPTARRLMQALADARQTSGSPQSVALLREALTGLARKRSPDPDLVEILAEDLARVLAHVDVTEFDRQQITERLETILNPEDATAQGVHIAISGLASMLESWGIGYEQAATLQGDLKALFFQMQEPPQFQDEGPSQQASDNEDRPSRAEK